MQRYQDSVINQNGAAVVSPTVTVYLKGTSTLATLYSDDAVTSLANPLTGDAQGNFRFFAEDGRYDIVISGGTPAITSYTISDAELFDALHKPTYPVHMAQGSDFGARVTTALADVPAAGGILDARGLEGAQSIASALSITKPVTLLLGAMTLTISAKITLAANGIKILGMGDATNIVYNTPASDDYPKIYATGRTGLVIRDIDLSGGAGPTASFGWTNSDAATDGQSGVHLHNCTDFEISGITAASLGYVGINLVRCSRGRIVNNTLNSNTAGGLLVWGTDSGGGSNLYIAGNVANSNGTLGASGFQARGIAFLRLGTINGTTSSQIIGNQCNSNSWWGIEIYQFCHYNRVIGNTTNSNAYGGIHFWNNTGNVAAYNEVRLNGSASVPAEPGVQNGGYGFRIGGTTASIISGNTAVGNNVVDVAGFNGITVDEEGAVASTGAQVMGNFVQNHGVNANDINVDATVDSALVHDNILIGTTTTTPLALSNTLSIRNITAASDITSSIHRGNNTIRFVGPASGLVALRTTGGIDAFYLTDSTGRLTQAVQMDATAAYTTTSQITSTLATGTAPFVVTSRTPVTNLTTVPTTYNTSGGQYQNCHIVAGADTIGGAGTVVVTLTGASVFSNNTSYHIGAVNRTNANAFKIVYDSGSQFTITGTISDVISFICVGN